MQVAGRPVAANADADRPGTAAPALGLPHRVENALPHAVQGPIGAAEVCELHRQRILRVGVLAATALEQQPHVDLVSFPLLEMNNRRPRAQVVPGILAGDRVDGVRAQLPTRRRFHDRTVDLLPHRDLVHPDRHLDLERRHASVLADRAFALRRLIDVEGDDVERPGGAVAGRLGADGAGHRGTHVRRQVGRCSHDQREHALEQLWQHTPL